MSKGCGHWSANNSIALQSPDYWNPCKRHCMSAWTCKPRDGKRVGRALEAWKPVRLFIWPSSRQMRQHVSSTKWNVDKDGQLWLFLELYKTTVPVNMKSHTGVHQRHSCTHTHTPNTQHTPTDAYPHMNTYLHKLIPTFNLKGPQVISTQVLNIWYTYVVSPS